VAIRPSTGAPWIAAGACGSCAARSTRAEYALERKAFGNDRGLQAIQFMLADMR